MTTTLDPHDCVPDAATVPRRRDRQVGMTASCEDCGQQLVWVLARTRSRVLSGTWRPVEGGGDGDA